LKKLFKSFIDLFYIEEKPKSNINVKNLKKNQQSMEENSLSFYSKFFNFKGELKEKNYLISLNILNNSKNIIITNSLGGKNKFINDFIKRNKKIIVIGSLNREYTSNLHKIKGVTNYFILETLLSSSDERFLINNMIKKDSIDLLNKFIKEKAKEGYHILIDSFYLEDVSVYDPKYFTFKSKLSKNLDFCSRLTFVHDSIQNIDTTISNESTFLNKFNNILIFNNHELLQSKVCYYFDELIKHNLPQLFGQDKTILLKNQKTIKK